MTSRSSSEAPRVGVDLWGVMFVALATMKLCEVEAVANWSWWWITAPLWGPLALILVVALLASLWEMMK